MFAFIVEDGTGVEDATSYVSVAEADDYFTIDPNFFATWDALETDDKEHLLAWSTRVLDQKTDWKGYLTDEAQSLRWPRTYVYARDNVLIASDEIPEQLKEATFELAKWLHSNDPTTGQDVDWLKRMKVDVIEIEWQENASQSSFPSILNAILGTLGNFRIGGGSRFGRIVKN